MYKYLLLSVLALSLFITGCGDDDEPIISGTRMSYDGDNATSPSFPTGEYEAAVHFPIGSIPDAVGRNLVSVQFNVYNAPNEYGFITIYASDGTNTPGQILYDANITGEIESNQWNLHTLDTPIPIDGEGIWIGFAFSHTGEQQTIGCDAGPGQSNGDWLLDGADGNWRTFRARTDESINWNIRGVLSN